MTQSKMICTLSHKTLMCTENRGTLLCYLRLLNVIQEQGNLCWLLLSDEQYAEEEASSLADLLLCTPQQHYNYCDKNLLIAIFQRCSARSQ